MKAMICSNPELTTQRGIDDARHQFTNPGKVGSTRTISLRQAATSSQEASTEATSSAITSAADRVPFSNSDSRSRR